MMIKLHDIECDNKVNRNFNSKANPLDFAKSLWGSVLNTLFIFNMVIQCFANGCNSEICKTPVDLNLNLNSTLKNNLIRSIFDCENRLNMFQLII